MQIGAGSEIAVTTTSLPPYVVGRGPGGGANRGDVRSAPLPGPPSAGGERERGVSRVLAHVAVLLMLATTASAQPALRVDSSAVEAQPVPPAIEQFRADPDFDYARERPPSPSFWDTVKRWFWEQVIRPFFEVTTETTRGVLFYGLLVAILLFALYKLFGADRQGVFRRTDRGASLDAVLAEEGIDAVDLTALAEQAVREGRFREAVRYLYLRTLQLLSARGRIRWALDKTNREYAAELRGSDLEGPFVAVTQLFDRAWYGHLPVDAADVEAAQHQFRHVRDVLGAGEGRP